MSKIAKKLYIESKTNNKVEDCCIYSTSSEAYGDERMYASVNSTTCYIPLTLSTSSPYATKGRVTKNGKNYAIKRSSVPYDYCLYSIDTPWYLDINASGYDENATIIEYYNGKSGSLTLLSSGSGTFTVPYDVYYIKVTCVGGGAGSINYFDSCIESIGNDDDGDEGPWVYNKTSYTRTISAVGGGKTVFGSNLVVANGATAPVIQYDSTITDNGCSSGSGDNITYYSCRKVSSVITSKGSINGKYAEPGTGDILYPTNSDGTVNHGVEVRTINNTLLCYAGGGGKGDKVKWETVFSGGVGYTTSKVLKVTPGDTYTITIGKRGVGYDDEIMVAKGYRHKNDSGDGASSGTEGCILIEWGEGIE